MDLSRIEKRLEESVPVCEDEDFDLIKKFISGDESAFRKLVMKHKDKVRNLAFLTLEDKESVDDVVQDVFISVFKKLGSFRFESQFTTWLYRIAVNRCKDYIRKSKIRSIFIPLKEDEEDYKYGVMPMKPDISEIVNAAIEKLPEKLKTPLIMREVDGMSYKEIADALKVETGTIKSRIFRARETLRVFLEPYESDLMT